MVTRTFAQLKSHQRAGKTSANACYAGSWRPWYFFFYCLTLALLAQEHVTFWTVFNSLPVLFPATLGARGFSRALELARTSVSHISFNDNDCLLIFCTAIAYAASKSYRFSEKFLSFFYARQYNDHSGQTITVIDFSNWIKNIERWIVASNVFSRS